MPTILEAIIRGCLGQMRLSFHALVTCRILGHDWVDLGGLVPDVSVAGACRRCQTFLVY